MSNIPDLLRGISVTERVLMFLATGPKRMGAICANVGISDTHDGHQRLYKVLGELRARGMIRKLGTRNTTSWALTSFEGDAPAIPHRTPKPPKGSTPPPTTSWWLVPSDQFRQALTQRAQKGFSNGE